ncbi:MAG: YkgJ family cysteine cluster protein [Desulfobacterales bacterium]|nr:YkgJ family cysteine cluster protein [Desulfobacterales bacterium]
MQFDNLKPQDIFQCKQCGECCKGYGGTFISQNDIDNISNYIGVNRDVFIKNYCAFSGKKSFLIQGKNEYCIFWNNKICGIHPVKPKMCKSWPFIKSVLIDNKNWDIMASCCPGMRTDISYKIIEEYVRKELEK